MAPPVSKHPIRLFEIDDQPWFPSILRSLVQRHLAASWVNPIPGLSPAPPAELATKRVILPALAQFPETTTVKIVEFASGAGGPTPIIEATVNAQRKKDGLPALKFVLSDIAPNVAAWKKHAHRSKNISYVSRSVDAANPPEELMSGGTTDGVEPGKVFRLYCLSFHHFPDPDARRILQSTISTSDGFAIIELVSRHWSSLLLMTFYALSLPLVTFLWFPLDLSMLLFTYVLPIVPFVITFDGFVSALRIRTFEEVMKLAGEYVPPQARNGGAEDAKGESTLFGVKNLGWVFRCGNALHTWPCGYMNWIVGTKSAGVWKNGE